MINIYSMELLPLVFIFLEEYRTEHVLAIILIVGFFSESLEKL